jgi:hypothetical protein
MLVSLVDDVRVVVEGVLDFIGKDLFFLVASTHFIALKPLYLIPHLSLGLRMERHKALCVDLLCSKCSSVCVMLVAVGVFIVNSLRVGVEEFPAPLQAD